MTKEYNHKTAQKYIKQLEVLAQTSAERQFLRIRIVIRNGLPDPHSDADRHYNVISWSLDHTPALHKISSKSVGNFFDNQ